MLTLSRRVGEAIYIDLTRLVERIRQGKEFEEAPGVWVVIADPQGHGKVRLSFGAPREVIILREENIDRTTDRDAHIPPRPPKSYQQP